ncbi:universal stress protein [Nitrosopumilus sp.]|uniref:universal stress protein n=1 Tax=Nitrosopumilus sp. TaxID=2024843 RepID=UPI0029314060|nr:universal stress protein [Nitrosopumilus sp.]
MSKNEIKNILVPLDGSDTSKKGLEKAIYIAKLSGAKITGMHVVVVYPTLASAVTKYRDFLTKKAEKMLETTKEQCEKQKIQFESKIFHGKPASQIAEFAKKGKIDLIVIGSRGISGFKGAILGSVANTVVQKSKISVLVVK